MENKPQSHMELVNAIEYELIAFESPDEARRKVAQLIARHVEAHTAQVPHAVSRTAEEVVKAIRQLSVWKPEHGDDGFPYVPTDAELTALIQQALEAQHAKTWSMATEAGAEVCATKQETYQTGSNTHRLTDKMPGALNGNAYAEGIRALPCPPLEQEGV